MHGAPELFLNPRAFIAVACEGAAIGRLGVRGPVRALVQSAIEKKSSSTLKLPQSVQRNGKAAMISQMHDKAVDRTAQAVGSVEPGGHQAGQPSR